MPITDSRLRGGTLTLDGKQFADQATAVRLIPDTDEVGDPLEVLSGDQQLADDETTWTLRVETVQDFDDAAGFVAFAFDNAGDVVPFSWRPNATGVTYSGSVKVRPVEIGGEVNTRLGTEGSWPVQGTPTRVYPAVV